MFDSNQTPRRDSQVTVFPNRQRFEAIRTEKQVMFLLLSVTGLVAGSYRPEPGGCQRPLTNRSTVRGGCGVIGVPPCATLMPAIVAVKTKKGPPPGRGCQATQDCFSVISSGRRPRRRSSCSGAVALDGMALAICVCPMATNQL